MNSKLAVWGPSGPRHTVLLSTGAFSDDGGIQAYNRILIRALQQVGQAGNGAVHALLLRDGAADIDTAYQPRGLGRLIACERSRTRFAVEALRTVLATEPDLLIVGHLNFAPLAIALQALRPSIPQWLVVYGVEAWGRLPALQRLAVLGASRIVSISAYTGRALARVNKVNVDRITVLPCALDPHWTTQVADVAAATASEQVRPVLLTVGRLDAREGSKGVRQVIRALPLIARHLPDVRYVVAGGGTDLAGLKRLAAQLGVGSRVEFRGRVDRLALAHAYREASLFVMPSKQEGFGIAFIEAGFFGRPSLAGNAGGAPEVVVDGVTGTLVDPDDVEGIAAHVVALISRPELLRALGQKARQRVMEQYSYDVFRRNLAHCLARGA
jgi:glycosyltransferase involved in cell wall biosynthesis